MTLPFLDQRRNAIYADSIIPHIPLPPQIQGSKYHDTWFQNVLCLAIEKLEDIHFVHALYSLFDPDYPLAPVIRKRFDTLYPSHAHSIRRIIHLLKPLSSSDPDLTPLFDTAYRRLLSKISEKGSPELSIAEFKFLCADACPQELSQHYSQVCNILGSFLASAPVGKFTSYLTILSGDKDDPFKSLKRTTADFVDRLLGQWLFALDASSNATDLYMVYKVLSSGAFQDSYEDTLITWQSMLLSRIHDLCKDISFADKLLSEAASSIQLGFENPPLFRTLSQAFFSHHFRNQSYLLELTDFFHNHRARTKTALKCSTSHPAILQQYFFHIDSLLELQDSLEVFLQHYRKFGLDSFPAVFHILFEDWLHRCLERAISGLDVTTAPEDYDKEALCTESPELQHLFSLDTTTLPSFLKTTLSDFLLSRCRSADTDK